MTTDREKAPSVIVRSSLVLATFTFLAACAPAAPVEAPQPSAAQPATEFRPRENFVGIGKLAPESIQRTVRSEFSRFRRCYEGGLQREPHLRGKALTRFVIAEDGSVRNAETDPASDLPDRATIECIASEFGKLRFQAPQGGEVVVVYPISFDPGD